MKDSFMMLLKMSARRSKAEGGGEQVAASIARTGRLIGLHG